ncbi:MAG: DUF2220 family protein [Xanthomonadales bacterium]|nr:DUF2220 family protein [Xanthomonadales bacterium]
MSWTRAQDVRAQLLRLWDRGLLLSSEVTGTTLFPWRARFSAPSSAQLSARFDDVRSWITELQGLRHCQLDMRDVHHRVLGHNAIPCAITVNHREDALALLGKRTEAAQFEQILNMTIERQPQLLGWLALRPLKALALAAQWPRLLDVVAWLQAHPRPGIYLRQVDLVGIDSKFIEAHRSVLGEWLDRVLPAAAIDTSATGVSAFNQRYGFVDKPQRQRFRLLGSHCAWLPGVRGADITLDSDSFCALQRPVSRVFITENEVNFLAFPKLTDAMVLFGAGYGFAALARAQWLRECEMYYWGDIDTHGFAILSQLRSHFAQVQSVLMDHATLHAHLALCGSEDAAIKHDLPHLNDAEAAVYNDLRDQRWGQHLRLEQERIGFDYVCAALQAIS